MALDGQPAFSGTMRGEVWLFLKANTFRVRLSDGRLVDAVLPDELMVEMPPYYSGPPVVDRIGVVVEFRERPALDRIVEIRSSGWCGAARAPWR